ncbi:uncharacterized protein [Nicotiana sylvestris]|uniref:uncharacterized protein n=1 Tax=Nicotiana sylvestris TaxID=4096 RepID=UPI00388C3DB3
MAPYEALYGRQCRSPVGWFEPGEARCDEVWEEGQLSPRYIGPFEILERVGGVSYKLALPPSLSAVHSVFHVSLLQKYYGDPSHVIDFSSVQLDKDLTYIEEPVAILDRHVQKLRSKNIVSKKVQWRGHPVEEATWEIEHDMQSHYPHLFNTSGLITYEVD